MKSLSAASESEYFEARLNDGYVNMRVVGFQGAQQKKLVNFQDNVRSVSLQNCQVKRVRVSEKLEIVLKSCSRVESSPKKFVLEDVR